MNAQDHTIQWYIGIRNKVIEFGFASEIEWAQNIKPVASAMEFWTEFAWVVINSGMKYKVARKIWPKVHEAVADGYSASTVFGHTGKAGAIDFVFHNRERLFAEYQKATNKIAFLVTLPWIGPVTCWHLAKNYGHDVAKPDRHLVRIAGDERVEVMCARLAKESGDRIATVDTVLWRAAEIGIL